MAVGDIGAVQTQGAIGAVQGGGAGYVPLSGQIQGQSSLSAALSVDWSLAGDISAQSDVTGVVCLAREISVLSEGQATVSASLKNIRKITGSISGQSTAAASLKLSRKLTGQMQGQSSLSGIVAVDWSLTGSVTAVSSLTGVLEELAVAYRIYGGQDGVIDYDTILATMTAEHAQVSIGSQDLPPDTIWHYIRRKITACELESPDSPACIVRIDSDGNMIANIPNVPTDLAIEGLSNGRFKLRWHYTKLDEETDPTGFNIYIDSGSGFNFDSPDDTVSYGFGGLGEFEWTSDPLSHGQTYRFCVRSYKTAAGETQNTNYVSGVADDEGPDAITGLLTSWEEM